jgi:SsrA-binding protein
MATFSENKRAFHDYEILETFEAGIELHGFEVKAIKSGRVKIVGAHALIRNGQAWLINADIPPYQPANTPADYDPSRTRRLLLKQGELRYLSGKTQEKGLTIVPIKLYSKHRVLKLQLGLARRKQKADRRDAIRKREAKKSIERTLKQSARF